MKESYSTDMFHYEIKLSKTGLRVPVVNDIHLHSSYDPQKEAETFVEKILKDPPSKNYLILGLGFGYHVRELCKRLQTLGISPKIVIIEPNEKVASDCFEFEYLSSQEHYYVIGKSADEIYGNKDLTNFLLQKPQVVSHPASFNLYSDYYRDFLTYQAPSDRESLIRTIQSPTLIEYLRSKKFDAIQDLYESVQSSNEFDSELDVLICTMIEITKNTEELTNR